jgi:hypothetical protein
MLITLLSGIFALPQVRPSATKTTADRSPSAQAQPVSFTIDSFAMPDCQTMAGLPGF